jgi:hypothetical protein
MSACTEVAVSGIDAAAGSIRPWVKDDAVTPLPERFTPVKPRYWVISRSRAPSPTPLIVTPPTVVPGRPNAGDKDVTDGVG